jgi:hypothetical protein
LVLGLLILFALGLKPWIQRALAAGRESALGRRVRWIAGALLWALIAIGPARGLSPLRAFFGTAIHWLGPLAGLACTLALAERLARRTSRSSAAGAGAEIRPLPAAGIAAGAALGLALLLGHLALEGMPHIPDEVAYRFDAITFASGHRFASPPPIPDAFPPPDWIEVEANRAYGVFPIGWPLLLAAGVRLDIPWLVNPLLTAFLVLAMAWLAARVAPGMNAPAPPRASGTPDFFGPPLVAWLAATSPLLLGLGASSMSHPAAVLAAALALAALLALESQSGEPSHPGRPRAITGPSAMLLAVGGALVLIRPIEGVALGCAALWDRIAEQRAQRARERPAGSRPAPRLTHGRAGLLALWGGLAIGALALAADQARVTGNPLLPPVTQYFERHLGGAARNRLGFGPDVGLEWDGTRPGHSPAEAVENLWRNAHGLEHELLGWPAGSLLLALGGLLAGKWNRGERLLVRHGASVIGLYALYWYHGTAYGPRFLSALAPGLLVFTCRGAVLALRALSHREPVHLKRLVPAAIAISLGAALAIHVPLMARTELHGLRGVRGALRQAVDAAPAPGLVFIDGPRWPDYGALYFLNAPDFQGPKVIARARGAELDSAVAARYRGRKVTTVTAAAPPP